MPERPSPGYYAAYMEFTDGTPAVAIQNSYGYFSADELTPWAASLEKYGKSAIGEDHLLVGSDYSHSDFSQEINFTSSLRELVDQAILSPSAPTKIMHDNPRAFYGL